MFEVEGSTERSITVRHRTGHHAWRFELGRDQTSRQRVILAGVSRKTEHDPLVPADYVIDALRYASEEARRRNLID